MYVSSTWIDVGSTKMDVKSTQMDLRSTWINAEDLFRWTDVYVYRARLYVDRCRRSILMDLAI
jgi:hypothetical protein